MALDTQKFLSIGPSVIYGLFVLTVPGLFAQYPNDALMSFSYLLLVPMIIGYIHIHFECRRHQPSYRQAILPPWLSILTLSLCVSFGGLEKGLSVLLVLPAFLVSASLGGLFAVFFQRNLPERVEHSPLLLIFLPLVIAPIESHFFQFEREYEIKTVLVSQATPDQIWNEAVNIGSISEDELPLSFAHLMSFPVPVAASMNTQGKGAIQTEFWQNGLIVHGVINRWEPPHHLAYEFNISQELIPDTALHRLLKSHIVPKETGYDIRENARGQTEITLSTQVHDATPFGLYSRAWVEILVGDLHYALLYIIRNRAQTIEKERLPEIADIAERLGYLEYIRPIPIIVT